MPRLLQTMKHAPIIIFAFNRLEPLKRCVESLLVNSEACESNLFVYVDGPRRDKEGEAEKVEAVREYVETISGFKSVTYHFSEINKKLGPSIISGVTEVINQYGCAIVMEDDLVAGKNMLAFVNQGLERYENVSEVFSICAYTNKVKVPMNYPYDAYFCPRSSSWGWATWKDRWNSVDWNLENWEEVKRHAKAFNRWGGSDCFGMLEGWHEKKNQSWAIRFCYNQFVQDKVSLFPIMSKIDNKGFDGSGTNCKQWSRFKFDFDTSAEKAFNFPDNTKVYTKMLKDFLSYHSILIRIYSRLMYMYYDFKNIL